MEKYVITTTNIFPNERLYLGWQKTEYEKTGYFWTSKENLIKILSNSTEEHPFIFNSEYDAVKFIINQRKIIPQKCEIVKIELEERRDERMHKLVARTSEDNKEILDKLLKAEELVVEVIKSLSIQDNDFSDCNNDAITILSAVNGNLSHVDYNIRHGYMKLYKLEEVKSDNLYIKFLDLIKSLRTLSTVRNISNNVFSIDFIINELISSYKVAFCGDSAKYNDILDYIIDKAVSGQTSIKIPASAICFLSELNRNGFRVTADCYIDLSGDI